MANKITFEILSGWSCRYEHYKPNRAGVRFGVMGASSFLPGVQIFIALFGNNEKTCLFQDVDLNRKVVRVTDVPRSRSCEFCSKVKWEESTELRVERKGQFVSVGTCGTRVWCSWQGDLSSLITAVHSAPLLAPPAITSIRPWPSCSSTTDSLTPLLSASPTLQLLASFVLFS